MPRFILLAFSLLCASLSAAQTSTPCDSPLTYIQRIGQSDANDRAYGICPSADGNLYLAGYQRDANFIAKLTPKGNCLWLRKFSSTDAFGTGTPVQIIEDSDGHIVLCAAKGNSPTTWLTLVMRYDPKANTILWAKQYKQNSPTAQGILEKGAGGNFILHAYRFDGSGPVGKTRSQLYELDRATGEVLPANAIEFLGTTHLVLSEMLYRDNALWVVGSLESDNQVQPALGKIHASLDSALWIRSAEPGAAVFAQNTFVFNNIVQDGADMLVGGTGLKTSGNGLGIFLQKNDASGTVKWAKIYEITAENIVSKPYLVVTPNGYTMMLSLRGSRWVLVNLDKDGRLLANRVFTVKNDNAFLGTFSPRHNLLLWHKEHLLALDHTRPFQDEDIVLIRTSPDLKVQGNCAAGQPETALVIAADLTPTTQAYSPVRVPVGAVAETLDVTFKDAVWENARNLCPVQVSLGPDQTICQNQTTLLDAGPGFAAYQWSNGASTQTLLVKIPGTFSVEVTDSCGQKLRDTVKVSFSPVYNQLRNIPIFPGDTVVIAGVKYGQSAVVVQKLKTKAGCDSTVTHNIFLISSKVDITCPANLSVTPSPGASSVKVDYDKATATTDCPNPNIVYTLLQGPPSGSNFGVGTTTVCYRADNLCKVSNTCCFTVTVNNPEMPCDVKSSPNCLRYEILEVRLDAQGQRRYRLRLTNTCAAAVQYIYVQVPNGVNAVAPANGSFWVSGTSGRSYEVRNPNASPFPSARFKAQTNGLKSGASDLFEYTLPQQSAPNYLLIGVRLENGTYDEAYLNTFNCPIQPYTANRSSGEDAVPDFSVYPNPSEGTVFIAFDHQTQPQQIMVLNALGQSVSDHNVRMSDDSGVYSMQLPESLPDGIYYVHIRWLNGGQLTKRIVLKR